MESKNNHFTSRSVEESISKGVFIDTLNLLEINDCKLNFNFNAWIETAWQSKNNLIFKNGVKKMNFRNLYIKPDSSLEVDFIKLKYKESGVLENSSPLIEPPLGYRFIVKDDVTLEKLEILVSSKDKVCEYELVPTNK